MLKQIFNLKNTPPQISKDLESFHKDVMHEVDGLEGKEVIIPNQGMMSNVIIIGDYVFKGPTNAGTVVYYDQDFQVLQHIAGKGLPSPEVTHIGEKSMFFGMKRIKGVPLYSLPALKPEEEQDLAKSIADFVVRLARAVPPRNGQYLQNPDINGGNILINPETKRLEGIIDFGDAYYGPLSKLGSAIGMGIHDDKKTHTGINVLVRQEIDRLLRTSQTLTPQRFSSAGRSVP